MTREHLLQFQDDFTKEMKSIMNKKNHDYSSDSDPFANLKMCEKFKLASTEKGILIRITDKLSRLIQLLDKSAKVNESFVDTCIDAANYLVLVAAVKTDRDKIMTGLGGILNKPVLATADTSKKSMAEIISEEVNHKTVED